MKAENKSVIKLAVSLPAYGGVAIGKWEGKTVLIRNSIPGETVEAVFEEEKKDYYAASAVRILEPSPHRIKPHCKFFGLCGGCHSQYIEYRYQVQLKELGLLDCLKRIAKLEMSLSTSLIHENPWNYRHRGQFKVSYGRTGFYREKTREVIDIDSCPLMIDEINEFLTRTRNILKYEKFSGEIKEIHITCGDGAIALVKAKDRRSAAWNDFASALIGCGFSGVFMDFGNSRPLKTGKEFITLKLASQKYTLSPMQET